MPHTHNIYVPHIHMHVPVPVCHIPTHTLHIHSSGFGEQHHSDQGTVWPLWVSHCFHLQPTTSSADAPTCGSPTSSSPSLAAHHASLSLSHTEQISSLRKLSLTHPTPSLPSSHHHLAILCFQKESFAFAPCTGLYMFECFFRGSILRGMRKPGWVQIQLYLQTL